MLALAWGHCGHCGHALGNCPYVITPPPGTFITTHTVSSSSTQHIHQQSVDTYRTQFGDTYTYITYILDPQIIKVGDDVTMTVSIFLFVLRYIS